MSGFRGKRHRRIVRRRQAYGDKDRRLFCGIWFADLPDSLEQRGGLILAICVSALDKARLFVYSIKRNFIHKCKMIEEECL